MILKGLNSANLDAIVTNMGMINKTSENVLFGFLIFDHCFGFDFGWNMHLSSWENILKLLIRLIFL